MSACRCCTFCTRVLRVALGVPTLLLRHTLWFQENSSTAQPRTGSSSTAEDGRIQWKVMVVAHSNPKKRDAHLRARLGLRSLKKQMFQARLLANCSASQQWSQPHVEDNMNDDDDGE